MTQPLRHPPKLKKAKAAAVPSADGGVAQVFSCTACDKSYSSADYRSGAAGAKSALAQHMRDIHSSSEPPPAAAPAAAQAAGGAKKEATVTAYVCTACSVSKGLDEFSKNQRNGKKSEIQCKLCNTAFRAARREAAMRERGLLPPAAASAQEAPGAQSQPEPAGVPALSAPEPEPEPEPEPNAPELAATAPASTGLPPRLAPPSSTDDVWVFVDIGGVRELAALVRLLPFVTAQLGASVVVVKSKRLCQTADDHLAGVPLRGAAADAADDQQQAAEEAEEVVRDAAAEASGTFWGRVKAGEAREGILGRSKERRGGAPIGARYPLKLPCRYTEDGVEICRFHNYSQAGCIRGAQGRCQLDHSVCHWCGEPGHVALACTAEIAVDEAEEREEVVRGSPLLDEAAPFLYCLGGRLRGRTLVSCERINLTTCKAAPLPEADAPASSAAAGEWESVRGLSEHRGSHGAASLGQQGLVMAVGGGGMRANLSSTEVLDTRAAEGDTSSSWQPTPAMQTPRHAFALASMDEGGKTTLYATGGWMYGSCCTGSVERFVEGADAWEPCASLSTPRRLHGAAAQGGRLYVFGGSPGNGAVDAKVKTDVVECYLPAEDRWEPRAALPRQMNVGAVTVGRFIYVLPYGDDGMWRYDPAEDRYEDMGPLPLPNFHCFALTAGSATSGASKGRSFSDTPVVIGSARACLFLTPLSASGEATEMYVLGGTTDGVHTDAAWRYTPAADGAQAAGAWARLPDMLVARRRTAAAVVWAR